MARRDDLPVAALLQALVAADRHLGHPDALDDVRTHLAQDAAVPLADEVARGVVRVALVRLGDVEFPVARRDGTRQCAGTNRKSTTLKRLVGEGRRTSVLE